MSATPANHRYSAQTALLLLVCTMLASCSSLRSMGDSSINPVNWLTPYRVDVIQGNFVSKEQVELLRAGMSREQVKGIMGTPLMASLFHADRWDYVFTLKRQGVEPQSYKYTVFFKGDQLERFEGDAMPSETEFIAKLGNKRKLGDVPVLEATEEQLSKASTKIKAESAATPAPSSTPAGTSSVSYPPLESPKQ